MSLQRAVTILAKSNVGIQEAAVFLACSSKTSQDIAKESDQQWPGVHVKLRTLKIKGLITRTNDRKPLYFRTKDGERIIKEINK
jgi:predicted transcriptional regulator